MSIGAQFGTDVLLSVRPTLAKVVQDKRVQEMLERAMSTQDPEDKSAGALSKAVMPFLLGMGLAWGGGSDNDAKQQAAQKVISVKNPGVLALMAARAAKEVGGVDRLISMAGGDITKALHKNWGVPEVKNFILDGAQDVDTVLLRTADLLEESFKLPQNKEDTQTAMELFGAKDGRTLAHIVVYKGMKDELTKLALKELKPAGTQLAQKG